MTEQPTGSAHATMTSATKQVRRRRLTPLRTLFAAALVLSGAGAGVLSTGFESEASARVVGGNLPVNAGASNLADISAHNSPTVVRNPVDGSNIAIANRIDLPAFSCALHLSFDGGGSWAQTPLSVPPGEEPKCYVPDAAFGADGTLYVSFVTLKGSANVPNNVWLSTSTDGGRTLSPPSPIPVGALAFQVRLLADPATPGRLYLSWLKASSVGSLSFPDDGNPILFMKSADEGATWDAPVRVSSESRKRVVAPSMAAGLKGNLYALYLDVGEDALDYRGGHEGKGGEPYVRTWSLVLARSSDGGSTWKESVVEDQVVPTERFIVFLPPYPSLAVDAQRGRVYAGFTDGRLGDADVWVWSSSDLGATWRDPERVNDTARGDNTSQYRPRLAVSPDGRLDVAYYDRRSDRADVMNEVSLQSSFDAAASFSRSVRVSDKPFDSRLGFGASRGLADLGSRLGLVSTDKLALAVWSDTRVGTEASNKQDIVLALVRLSPPRGLAAPIRALLRVGAVALVLCGLLVMARGFLASRAANSIWSDPVDVA
ncbi:MAG TPA: sialidase family protein [Acidimicrobiales bacterium]|nr:sialidase family protein [Acidimicrobiales bacterium]